MTIFLECSDPTFFAPDQIQAYPDSGGPGHATYSVPTGSRIGFAPHGLNFHDGALYALHHARDLSSVFPDGADGTTSFGFHGWFVERFGAPTSLGGQTTVTLHNADADNGYGNSDAYDENLGFAASGDYVVHLREKIATNEQGYSTYDPGTGLRAAFYNNFNGTVNPHPQFTQVAEDGINVYSLDFPTGATLLKGAITNWAASTTFYTAPSNIAAFCVAQDTGDVFVAYGDPVTNDLKIDRLDSSGSFIQTYTVTTTAITYDPANSFWGRAISAFGGKLVCEPYFVNTGLTVDEGNGVWMIDIASGTGSTDALFHITTFGTGFYMAGPIVNCLELAPSVTTGWHLGIAMAG